MRDAAATRARILAAGVAEFAEHGIAGARVDRVAAASNSNKAMIYAYFDSKDGLFDAAFDAVVVQTVDAVPMNADDLAQYAVRLFDQHCAHPEPVRLGLWDRLERGGAGMRAPSVVAAQQVKVSAVRDAQQRGIVQGEIEAAVLLDFVLELSRTGTAEPLSVASAEVRRTGIRAAVTRLVSP